MKQSFTYVVVLLMLNLLPSPAAGQSIKYLRIPASLCDDDTLLVHFGTSKWNEVVVATQGNSLGHIDTVFLPDGVPCDGSCYYRSPVKFDAFNPDDTIRTSEDIKFLRIKMEHSYIGDVYIALECPDGRKADLLRFAGTGHSDCTATIPNMSRGWSPGNNVNATTYLGKANADENIEFPCDRLATGNEAGSGWNYCWSDNTSSGYTYASGDGLLYRANHQHGGVLDSSNVELKTNFYHPDENFSKLVGCPLNGTWSVTVMDGFGQDNGYIFEWELTLDATLLPPVKCKPKSYAVLGGVTKQVNDTTFMLIPPQPLMKDTSVRYTFRMITTCGDTIDSSATVIYHPTPESWMEDEVCEGRGYYLDGYTVYGGGEHQVPVPLPTGCDSTIHLFLVEHPSYDEHFYDSICINTYSHFEGNDYGQTGDYEHKYHTIYGCDSLRTLHLTVIDSNLQARIKAVPQVLELEHPWVRLYDASLNNVGRRWTVGDVASDQSQLELEYPREYDSLPVVLVAISAHACADTDTAVVRLDRSMLSVPNIFTPNNDRNNLWRPVLNEAQTMEVWVYNRAGQLVTHWEGIEGSWDGSDSRGEPCPQGSYLYTLRYTTVTHPHRPIERTGSVTLIR